jgi:hypothetical protein
MVSIQGRLQEIALEFEIPEDLIKSTLAKIMSKEGGAAKEFPGVYPLAVLAIYDAILTGALEDMVAKAESAK